MTKPYEKLAMDVYANVYYQTKDRVDKNHGKPVLIISGESHFDPPLEKLTNVFRDASQQEPAMAAAYGHLAAINAAIRIAGKENVVISFERDPDVVEKIVGDAKKNYGSVEKYFGDNLDVDAPMGYAFRYAYNQGLKIVGSDKGDKAAIERNDGDLRAASEDKGRYMEEIVALKELAATHKPHIVVHIGGVNHMATLAGFPFDKDPYKSDFENPFKKTYGSPVFMFGGDRNSKSPQAEYFKDSRHAIQVDAPGKMDDRDLLDIDLRVEAAADNISPKGIVPPLSSPSRGPKP